MQLRWARLAEHDLEDIARYVGRDSPAAAARVVLELIEIDRVLHCSRIWPDEM